MKTYGLVSAVYTPRVANDIKLPPYTTDIFDHEREAAENLLNERLESCAEDVQLSGPYNKQCCDCCCLYELDNNYPVSNNFENRSRIHSCGVESESSSLCDQSSSDLDSEHDSEDDIFYGTNNSRTQNYWNTNALPSTPRPPKNVLDSIRRMGLKEL